MIDEYRARMMSAPQFLHLGIEPIWRPGERDIEGFCHDEVVRQGHDPRAWFDGGQRVEQMVDAWHYAQGRAVHLPTVEDILVIGHKVEPEMNPREFFRSENVYIAGRTGAPPRYLRRLVELLAAQTGHVVPGPSRKALVGQLFVEGFQTQIEEGLVRTVDDWYVAFEWAHPFSDGNGRSGKILHNWLSESLDDPVLVPDYFGGGNP